MTSKTEIFERAWPYLEPAVMRTRQHTKETVFEMIDKGKARLWLLPHGAATTLLWTYPSGRKAFQVWLLGGDLSEIISWAKGPAMQFAIHNKCNEMRVISGRRGWVRAFGWRDAGTIAIKDFD